MKWESFQIELLTRTFLAGADQSKAEIRVPSIRGQVRWWFRALGGSRTEEEQIFGGVHGQNPQASRVRLRLAQPVQSKAAVNLEDLGFKMSDPQAYLLWPLRSTSKSDQRRGMLEPGTSFELQVCTESLKEASRRARFASAMRAWIILGSLGTRSRRGYGSVFPGRNSINSHKLESLVQVREALSEIGNQFPKANFRVMTIGGADMTADNALDRLGTWLKNFRCGSKKFGGKPSRWGQNDHDNARGSGKILYRPVIGLPLEQRFSNDQGRVKTRIAGGTDRWASPVHLKVIRCGRQFYPIAIFFPEMAMPEGKKLELIEGTHRFSKTADRGLLNEMMKPSSGVIELWDSVRL